ncbi:hypothetical protein EDB81DRAFT_78591 [Dactylonectria macrodidyma]|uniref:BZIP domain-containing protein n=1 Tax=Dactylonectria macrodidyma TaxID=307937 RepID=A0A9P9IZU6_9HYPO|nr:hypothetical protein EDB81DRAFT_78591 [Dactylonectria macrodidyma]
MEYQYDSPGPQPYHQFMPMPSMSPPRSVSDDYSPSSPDALKTLPHFPSYSSHPAYSYGQAYPMPPSGPSSPHQSHHSSYRHYNLSNLAMPYTPDSITSEENDSLSPTQSRRKAQNRAAQQAFRKRKEQHVKDLEAKLADMEAAQQQFSVENERLKKDILRASTENKILRATSAHADSRHHRHSASFDEQQQQPRFHQADFYANMPQDGSSRSFSHRVLTAKNGDRLLAAGATWDLIIGHRLVKKGLVNIGDVSERLVHHTYCDGHGPVYSERSIIAAIEESIISKTDNLL